LRAGQWKDARRLARRVDWDAFVRAAETAAVAGLLHRSLASAPADLAVPARTRESLAGAYRATLAQNLRRFQALEEALGALSKRGMEPVILKGALLAETVYADPGVRPMRDVDLLVRREDLSGAEETLLALGFERLGTPGRATSEALHYQRGYRRGRCKIELHTSLCDEGRYAVDAPGLWRRSHPISWRGRPARALADPDHLAYLALHAALHAFLLPLPCLVDIAVLLERDRSLAEPAAERARSWGASAAVYEAFLLAKRLCDAPVESAVLRALRPGVVRRAYLRLCFSDDEMPSFRFGDSLRAAQALTLFPLMDRGQSRYLAKYLGLRARDLLGG
jgi:hypothetical protein